VRRDFFARAQDKWVKDVSWRITKMARIFSDMLKEFKCEGNIVVRTDVVSRRCRCVVARVAHVLT
jgi:hypothetical protein